jgi:beta-glucosidase
MTNSGDVHTISERVENLLAQLTLKEKISLLSGKDIWNTMPVERLGIPSITMTDGPHGVRASDITTGRKLGPATSFPTGISMGASWNPELIERVGAALGEETRGMGCHILLGPCVNIVRSPLGGRNFETYSEDPHLSGSIGTAWVKGLQSQNVGASLKHFACNNQEINRFRSSSVLDERTLREIYLPAFETVVKEAKPWTVMTSYNKINGVYASENPKMLKDILKGEWEYEGVVITDWNANHSTIDSKNAGLDIEMPGPVKYFGGFLADAVQNWQVEESEIDDSVRRILRMVLTSGVMDETDNNPGGSVNSSAHQVLARELAEESIVLLKNDNQILPLQSDRIRSIAVIGPNAAEARIGGGGSSYVEPPYRVSPLQGLRQRAGEEIEIRYAKGCDNHTIPPTISAEFFTPPDGEGVGLKSEYFNNTDLSGAPVATGIDPNVEGYFFGTPPSPGLRADAFSIRWVGKLQVPESGLYTLILGNTDLCRLYLNGDLILENDRGQVPTEIIFEDPASLTAAVPVDLEAGRGYDIKVEFVKVMGEDVSVLRLMYVAPVTDEDPVATAVELARTSDVAVIFAGMPTGFESEGDDRAHMDLPGPQSELIRAVAAVNPNTIVVINAGAPVAMPWLETVPAVLEAFYPGQEGGNAIANILFGDVNPSGRLPMSFPHRISDNPAFLHYPGEREVHYGEGLFVGYRYYDTKGVEPLFPFGYGLSYTTFEYSDLQIPAAVNAGEDVTVAVTVKNTGPTAGKETVQVYVSDKKSSLIRPEKELKAFQKIALEPGESQTVTLQLKPRALSFYKPAMKAWVAEPGTFEVMVGSSSRDIRQKAEFDLV